MYLRPITFIITKKLNHKTDKLDAPKPKELWSLLIGDANSRMNWMWTDEELISIIKNKNK